MLYAQVKVRGVIRDRLTNSILDSVSIKNIHTGLNLDLDSSATFSINVKGGYLLEFKRSGYQTYGLRILNEKQNPYYIIHLEKNATTQEIEDPSLAQKLDSIEYDNTYYTVINGSRKGENNACGGVSLDALSEQKRKQWAFQALFKKWQGDKYIDYIFNKDLVQRLTQLSGEDLRRFMQRFRPTEQFLRSATEYEFLKYIRKSHIEFNRLGDY